ncbi:hypothetical protein KAS08_05955 [Candidatus Pacearchaeota archaeon]|nr:hypothetical protein [Candidatus Pacearchaeota archaeon]
MAESTQSIIRVNTTIHEDAKILAKKKKMTISDFTEMALKEAFEKYKFCFDDLRPLIEKNPFLSLYEETIERELEDAPSKLLGDIIKTIESNTQIRFVTGDIEGLFNNIKKFKDRISNSVLLFQHEKSISEEKMHSINDLISKVIEMSNNSNISVGLRKKEGDSTNINVMMFVGIKNNNQNKSKENEK